MAVRTDAGTDCLSLTSGLPSVTTLTMEWWRYMVTDRNDYSCQIAFQDANHSGIQSAVDGTTIAIANDSVGQDGSNLTVATWYHCCWVKRSDSDNELYVDGVNVIDGFSMSIGAFSSILFGSYNGTANFFYNGRTANLLWYTDAKSAAEVAIMASRKTHLPLMYDNLYGWWPMLPGADRIRDYSGNGHTLTENGALTDEDGPPIGWGAPVVEAITVPNALYELEGYRWRNDDGSESTATWQTTQDTAGSIAPLTNVRLRVGLNTTFNAPSKNYKVQVRKVGSSGWRDVTS